MKKLNLYFLLGVFCFMCPNLVWSKVIQEPQSSQNNFSPLYNKSKIELDTYNGDLTSIKAIVNQTMPGSTDNWEKEKISTQYNIGYVDLNNSGHSYLVLKVINSKTCTDDSCLTIITNNNKILFVSQTKDLSIGQMNATTKYAVLVDGKTIWQFNGSSYASQ